MPASNSAVPPLRVLLVDDEELARVRLRGLVHDCIDPQATVVGEAANATQALAWLVTQPCDLVLLDVQMPGRDGTQVAAELRQQALTGAIVPAVVFVTAHAQHALRAFDLEAVDYLTKPVKRDRLHAALQRVAQRLAQRLAQRGGVLQVPAVQEQTPVIVVNDRGRVVRVPLGEVLYLKAELKYVTLRTAHQTYVIDEPLSDLESRLGNRFLRIHRNALVARRAVRALERRVIAGEGGGESGDTGEGWAVCMAPVNEWLAVSRRQVGVVREAIVAAHG